jgi:hypothetical protein
MTIPSVGSMLPLPHFAGIVKRSHRHYRPAEIRPILEYLDQPIRPYGAIARISKDTGIRKQILSDWAHHRTGPATPNWFPFESGCPVQHVLPPTVEEALADHIRENWIQKGKAPCNKWCKRLPRLPSHLSRLKRCNRSDSLHRPTGWTDSWRDTVLDTLSASRTANFS